MMLGLADVIPFLPPGHSVEASPYWEGVFSQALAKVQEICGRQLFYGLYADKGMTVRSSVRSDRHNFYLTEPAGRALTREEIVKLTLNGQDANSDEFSQIESVRIVFSQPGYVEIEYYGGYKPEDWQYSVICSAIARTMRIIDTMGRTPGVSSYSGGGESVNFAGDPFESVKMLLAPYIVPRFATSAQT